MTLLFYKFPIKLFFHAARVRRYTRWTEADTSLMMAYFSESMDDGGILPGQYISKYSQF